jgi:hypothetical protein
MAERDALADKNRTMTAAGALDRPARERNISNIALL